MVNNREDGQRKAKLVPSVEVSASTNNVRPPCPVQLSAAIALSELAAKTDEGPTTSSSIVNNLDTPTAPARIVASSTIGQQLPTGYENSNIDVTAGQYIPKG